MPADVLGEIKKILGNGFIDEPARMEPYLTAWRGGFTGRTPLVALPSSTAQLSDIVKICAKNRIGIVPQGGNTGTVGGATPSPAGDQLLVCLSRMNKVRDIDKAASAVTAEAGVILQSLQEAASEAGFLFPLSMASEGSAQVGGAISTNAGGTAVLRYGNMRDLVLGIEAVLPGGEILSGLKSLRKDNMGYNLAHYFIGAEGTLGIVTAATLKLFPKPQQSLTAIAAIPGAEAALELLGDFRVECAEYLSAFEIMSNAAVELVLKHIPGARRPGSPSPYYMLIELDSSSPAAPLQAMFEAIAGKALENGCASDMVVAETLAHARQFWHLREHIPEAVRKQGSGIHFDIALPLAEIPGYMQAAEAAIRAAAPDVMLVPFGHIGDGNLHYNMCFPRPPGDFAGLKKRIEDIVYGEVVKRKGSLSAEHGIGQSRRAEMRLCRTPVEIELMKKIKRAVDPDGLMNPGKLFEQVKA